MVRVFLNVPGDLGSIPCRVISKTQKWFLMTPCLTLSIIRYGSRLKWNNPGKRVAPSRTPWCSSYRNGSLRVTLIYGRQITFYLLFISLNNKISENSCSFGFCYWFWLVYKPFFITQWSIVFTYVPINVMFCFIIIFFIIYWY